MTLWDRMRMRIGTVIDNEKESAESWQSRSIRAIQEHIQAIKVDPFYCQDDRGWVRQLENQIRRLKKELVAG